MKFLLLFFICSLSAFAGFAQLKPAPLPAFHGTGQPVRIMSTEEANQLNGTANPTINGIPYSQYKAEQELLKQKPVVQNTVGVQIKQSVVVEDPAVKKMNEVQPVIAPAVTQPITTAVKAEEHSLPIQLNPKGLGVVTGQQ